jgi:hypothetical protein
MESNVKWEHKPETRLIALGEITKVLDKIAQDWCWHEGTVTKCRAEIEKMPGIGIAPPPQKNIIKVMGLEQALDLAHTLLTSEYRVSIKKDNTSFFACAYLVEYWEE